MGLASSDASLAMSFEVATPTEADSCSSSCSRPRTAHAICSPVPKSRNAPVTSRKASSRAMPSTNGVKLRKTSWMPTLYRE